MHRSSNLLFLSLILFFFWSLVVVLVTLSKKKFVLNRDVRKLICNKFVR